MERRSFLKGLGAIVGGLALNEAVPLGRVYSFPKTLHFIRDPWCDVIKIGSTVQIRLPQRVGHGTVGRLVGITVTEPMSMKELDGRIASVRIPEEDLLLSMNEIAKRYIEPSVLLLALPKSSCNSPHAIL